MPKANAIVSNGRIITKRSIGLPDLMAVETARSRVALLKSQLAAAERALAEHEGDVVAMLEAGCPVRCRVLTAGLQEVQGARRPEWKDHYLSHMEDQHGCPRDAEESRILETTVGKTKQILVIAHRGRTQ